jgi:2-methylcitrate dehydratase
MGDSAVQTTIRVAELVCETKFDQIPREVLSYSKSLALSALGGMVSGAPIPICKIVTRYVQRMGGNPEATVAASGFKTSVENAALANGHFAHTTEYEDDSVPEGVSAYTLFPPIFALAEKLGSPGSRLIEAFVVGYEVQSRLGIDCNAARKRGYLNLSLTGVLGIAAGAAKLLGLDVERTAWALSLAASQGCGLTRQTGTGAHFIEMGVAGRDGLAAALWAAEGLTGSTTIFEGPKGFLDLKTAGEVSKPTDVVNSWGKPYRVMAVGIKSYPCCYHMQRYIQATIELKRAHGFKAGDVVRVDVEVNPMVPQFIRYPEPRNMAEARFSMPHSLAVAILDDRITLRSFSDARVKDQDARELRQRVKMIVHEEWQYGALTGPYPLTVILKDGTRLRKDCMKVNGQPPDLLSVEQVIQKYRLCTEGLLAEDKIQGSIRMALGLEELDNVARLMDTVANQKD